MNIKSVDKTVIEVSKQEIVDELISNFTEIASECNNDFNIVAEESVKLAEAFEDIKSKNFIELFSGGGALRCLPEEVLDEVENYLFGEDDEEEIEKDNVVSFKKASKNIKETELELHIKDEGVIIGKIHECDIQY